MYYYLRGSIVEVRDDAVVVDVGGVGYLVLMSHPEAYREGDSALVYVSQIVREDEQYLVGFSSLREKDIFAKLIACKGIGPKTALGALRDISIDDFLSAVKNNDVRALKKLSGIGPKAASQIILDLQGVLAVETAKATEKWSPAQEDARAALKNLGFRIKDIDDCLKQIEGDFTAEQYIRQVLQRIKKG